MKSKFASTLFLALACAPLHAAETAKETSKTITVEELGNLQVIGKLGIPLGKLVEMRATVTASSGKDYTRYYLKVTVVDGKPIKEPVVMRFQSKEEDIPETSFDLYKRKHGKSTSRLTDEELQSLEKGYVGSEVKFSAYETGAFQGLPEGLPKSKIWQGTRFQFMPELNVMWKSDS